MLIYTQSLTKLQGNEQLKIYTSIIKYLQNVCNFDLDPWPLKAETISNIYPPVICVAQVILKSRMGTRLTLLSKHYTLYILILIWPSKSSWWRLRNSWYLPFLICSPWHSVYIPWRFFFHHSLCIPLPALLELQVARGLLWFHL